MPHVDTSSTSPNRRQKQWEATHAEIRAIGRRLLIAGGGDAVTINAIARRMGVSGPALYRYFPSQGALIEALRADFFGELIATMRKAAAAEPSTRPGAALLAICRALRGWAMAHPAEFGWLFANPLDQGEPKSCPDHTAPSGEAASSQAFGQVFLDQVVDIWNARRFPIPDIEAFPATQAEQLRAFSDRIGGRLPPEAAHVFLTAWIRLYGLLCMEVFRQIDFAYDDMEPVYEACLQELCRLFDVPYAPLAGSKA